MQQFDWGRGMRRATAALSCLVVAACGGGGGEAPTVLPDREAPLSISASNVVDVAGAALDYGGLALAMGQVVVDWIDALAQANVSDLTTACITGGTQRVRLTDRDGNGRASAGDRIEVTLDACYLRPLDEAFYGSAAIELKAPGAAQRWAGELAFGDDFGLLPGAVNVRIEGGLRIEYAADRLSKSVHVLSVGQPFALFGQSGPTVLRDLVTGLDARREVRRDTARATTSMQYRLASDSLGGRIDVATSTPWRSWFECYPDAGELAITGASGSSAGLRASPTGAMQIDVLLSGASAGFVNGGEAVFLWSGAGWLPPLQNGLGYVASPPADNPFKQFTEPAVTTLRPNPAPLEWTYSRPLAAGAVSSAVFRRSFIGPGEPWAPAEIPATVTIEGAVLSVTPTAQLEPGDSYDLVIDGGTVGDLSDVFGARLLKPRFSAPVALTIQAVAAVGSPGLVLGPADPLPLNASTSVADGSGIVATRWRQISGPALSFSATNGPAVTVQAAAVANGTAVVEVEVENAAGEVDRQALSFRVLGDPSHALVIASRSAGAPLSVVTSIDEPAKVTYVRRFDVNNTLDVLLGTSRLLAQLPGLTWQDGVDIDFGPGSASGASAVWLSPEGLCTPQSGRIAVLDYAEDGTGFLSRLALDFESTCGGVPLITGSIRFNSSVLLRH